MVTRKGAPFQTPQPCVSGGQCPPNGAAPFKLPPLSSPGGGPQQDLLGPGSRHKLLHLPPKWRHPVPRHAPKGGYWLESAPEDVAIGDGQRPVAHRVQRCPLACANGASILAASCAQRPERGTTAASRRELLRPTAARSQLALSAALLGTKPANMIPRTARKTQTARLQKPPRALHTLEEDTTAAQTDFFPLSFGFAASSYISWDPACARLQ